MQPVGILLVITRLIFTGFAITISRKAGLDKNVQEKLNIFIKSAKKREGIKSGWDFGLAVLKNKYALTKIAFLPYMMISTYLIYASGYMSRMSLSVAAYPIFACIIAYIFLKEKMTISTVIGGGLMLIGLLIIGGE